MPTPDLPIELWLEILSYLPRSALRKMIGVNRILFELALDDLYSEVRLIADDDDTVKMLGQLSFLNISMRVRHLFIRPAFLPAMGRDLAIDSESHSYENNTTGSMLTNNLRNGIKRATSSSLASTSIDNSPDPIDKILKAASTAMKSCHNLQNINLIVHDQTLTPSFMQFLNSLWTSNDVGASVRSLTLDTTVAKLPLLLTPITKRAASFSSLTIFDINISISRLPHSDAEWVKASIALTKFLQAFKDGLTSFMFSSLISCDINELFESFPKFPRLTSFEFRSVFNVNTFPNTEHFTRFIRRHTQMLTMLLVKPRAHSSTASSSDDSYSIWLHHPSALQTSERLYCLTQLNFPKLRSLDVGLREVWGNLPLIGDDAQGNMFGFLPDLTRVTPHLTRLVITDAKLPPRRIMALLNMLGSQDGGSPLEELDFAAQTLSPQLFDLLPQALPRLRTLILECGRYSTMTAQQISSNRLSTNDQIGFEETMRARSYPGWRLQYLRIGSMYHCGVPHPNYAVMKSIAESLSRNVILDTELRCDCVENINYYPPRTLLTTHPAGRSGVWYTPIRLIQRR